MMAEPTLPFAPASRRVADNHVLRPTPPLRPKKRSYRESETSSSDPPQFSSDGLEGSAEDYLGHRRKRQYKRAWFENEESNREVTKPAKSRLRGPFRRNFDSGIYMPSDDSTDVEPGEESLNLGSDFGSDSLASDLGNEDDAKMGQTNSCPHDTLEITGNCPDYSAPEEEHDPDPDLELIERAMEVSNSEDPMNFEGPVFPYWQPQPRHIYQFHLIQWTARKAIQNCVERGQETVDLSDLSMEQIRNSLLRPLRHHVKQFHSNSFMPLTPSLKLHLSGNRLCTVPGELYQLRNLSVLTLRNNQITELLPAIAQLSLLTELNVGCNQLRYLPYELLSLRQLFRSRGGRFTAYPNPLIKPWPTIRSPLCNPFPPRKPEHQPVAITPIAFLDITGRPVEHSPPAPTRRTQYWFISADSNPGFCPPRHQQTHTPSLLELCLRSLLHEPTLSQLSFLLPPHSPPHLSELLQQTFRLRQADASITGDTLIDLSGRPALLSPPKDQRPDEQERQQAYRHGWQQGPYPGMTGQRCTICATRFVVPRTEWIEWWIHGRGAGITPPEPRGSRNSSSGSGSSDHWSEIDNISADGVSVPFLRRGCSWACFERSYFGQEEEEEADSEEAGVEMEVEQGERQEVTEGQKETTGEAKDNSKETETKAHSIPPRRGWRASGGPGCPNDKLEDDV